jgi:acetylornithine deacetylase/succinyl-diaminopimelate desuccinylase-like protein
MADLVLADWLEGERDRIVETLLAWLRIPSISARPDRAADVRRSADFAAALMTDAGMEHVTVIETAGLPAVYGDWLHAGPDAPTVLVYGHHDVQPVDPLDEWRSPPFEPIIVGGECLGRGAIDDKGQVLYEIEAVRGLLTETGRLPINFKMLVEGEEEVGSRNFEALLASERARLACDAIVVSDTGMWAADVPSICVGMRGLVAFDITLRTATTDLHSGVFGGAAPNPAHLVASIVAALHDDAGRITIPGFYVRPLDPAEADALNRLPFDEAAWRANAGVTRTEGESGFSVLERTTVRPTCDVIGIGVGYTGPGIKTIVPATGNFKVTFRLVPDQRPAGVAAQFESWLRAHLPDGVEADIHPEGPGVAPLLTDLAEPSVAALARAIERVWGTSPLSTREGGSGPEESLGRVLAVPVLFLGVGLPGDRIHAPNERMVMDQFWKGLLAAAELWRELGDLGRSGVRGG